MNIFKLLKSLTILLNGSFLINISLSIILVFIFTSSVKAGSIHLTGDSDTKSDLDNMPNQNSENATEWLICGTNSWEDLKIYLPEAKMEGIAVTPILIPPYEPTPNSECSYSDPFVNDYVLWAQ
ncbi:MAG: hypothetical protein P8X73_18845, partial [Ignavibacteriaceae bacterium]